MVIEQKAELNLVEHTHRVQHTHYSNLMVHLQKGKPHFAHFTDVIMSFTRRGWGILKTTAQLHPKHQVAGGVYVVADP